MSEQTSQIQTMAEVLGYNADAIQDMSPSQSLSDVPNVTPETDDYDLEAELGGYDPFDEGFVMQEFELGHVVELNHPITYLEGGKSMTLDKVVFDKVVTGKMVRKLPLIQDPNKITMGYQIALISAVTGVSIKAIAECHMSDILRLMPVANYFFTNTPRIG